MGSEKGFTDYHDVYDGDEYDEREEDIEILEFHEIDGPTPGDQDQQECDGEGCQDLEHLRGEVEDRVAVAVIQIHPLMQQFARYRQSLQRQRDQHAYQRPIILILILLKILQLLGIQVQHQYVGKQLQDIREDQAALLKTVLRAVGVYELQLVFNEHPRCGNRWQLLWAIADRKEPDMRSPLLLEIPVAVIAPLAVHRHADLDVQLRILLLSVAAAVREDFFAVRVKVDLEGEQLVLE